MGRSITIKTVAPLLVVDVMFNLLVPVAYFSFFRIEDAGLTLSIIAALNIGRIALWVSLLVHQMRPVERYERAFLSGPGEALLRRADEALQTVPLRFSLIYSVLWGLQYLVVTAVLLYVTPDRTPLSPRAIIGAWLMAGAQIPGSFSFAFPLEALLVSDEAGKISLAARSRGIALERAPSSLQTRIAALAVCIALGPTSWIAAVGYMAEVDASMREGRANAELIASRMAAELAPLFAGGEATSAEVIQSKLGELSADGASIVVNADSKWIAAPQAEGELVQNARVQRWLALEGLRATAATLVDPRTDSVVSTQRIDPRHVVGVMVRSSTVHSTSFLKTIAVFAFIVMVWAPICAIFLSRSVVVPLGKITHAARQMVEVGKLGEMGRIPIVQSDEAGILAEHINELLDLLAKLSRAAGAVAGGDLGVKIGGRGDLPDAFRDMIQNLQGMVREIRETSVQLATAATEIYAASQEQEASATSQSTAMVEISRTADSLSEAAAHVSDAVAGVLSNAERTLGTTEQMVVRIGELSAHAGRIGEILEVIRDVADRSDLLALNGSLEACRAGEAGRGFSLVAAEMRRLAERVTASVHDVKNLVTDIRASGSSTVMATEESKKLAESTTEAARQITLVTQQQRSGTEQVSQSVKDIAHVLAQAVAATTQTRTSAEDLKVQADRLAGLVRRFQLDGAREGRVEAMPPTSQIVERAS
jgi:methyl-accepting chemotaxis protein